MQIRGLSGADFIRVVDQVSADHYAGNLAIAAGINTLNATGSRFRARIRAVSSAGEGARLTASYRRSIAACWHAHRDVLSLLFVRYPYAEVRTTLAAYLGAHGFNRAFLATARTNLGSAYQPVQLTELCECVSYERGPYTDDLDQVLATVAPTLGEQRMRRALDPRDVPSTPVGRLAFVPTYAPAVAPAVVDGPADEKPADYLSRTFEDNPRYSHDYISRVIEQYGNAPAATGAGINYDTAYTHQGSDQAPAEPADDGDDEDLDEQCFSGVAGCGCLLATPDTRTGPDGTRYNSTEWFCTDCAYAHENAEVGDRSEDLPPVLSDVDNARFLITAGIVREAHAETCENRCPHAEQVECDCTRVEFSRVPCAGCGDWYHGAREAFTFWERASALV